jgi:hypothetical protein
MAETALLESCLNESRLLIEALDKNSILIQAAVWHYQDANDTWRLLLSSMALNQDLAKSAATAYLKIVKVMSTLALPTLDISDIKLVTTSHFLLKVIRSAITTDPDVVTQIVLRNNSFGPVFIADAVVLRSA